MSLKYKVKSKACYTFVPFAEVEKRTNHTRLWTADITWYSSSATCRNCLCGLNHEIGILNFWLTSSGSPRFCNSSKFLELFYFCTVINWAINFCTRNGFRCFHGVISQIELYCICSRISCHCTFFQTTFRSYKDWSNAQRISAPTTTILPTKVNIF